MLNSSTWPTSPTSPAIPTSQSSSTSPILPASPTSPTYLPNHLRNYFSIFSQTWTFSANIVLSVNAIGKHRVKKKRFLWEEDFVIIFWRISRKIIFHQLKQVYILLIGELINYNQFCWKAYSILVVFRKLFTDMSDGNLQHCLVYSFKAEL